MKAKKVTYSRLISKSNYENCKIEIELEVEDGEKISDVFLAAKNFVNSKIEQETITDYKINQAKEVMLNKRNYTLGQIEDAEKLLKRIEDDEELPF